MNDRPGRHSIGKLRQVSVRIDTRLHDAAIRRAFKERLSVSQVCRRAIRIGLAAMAQQATKAEGRR